MFVGTHLGIVSEDEFKVKDEHLRKKIETTEFYKKGFVEYVTEDQLMLAVNNLSGDQVEIKKIQEILERVIEKSFVKISIPAAWLVLSLYLRKKKFRTISLKKCEELAGKLGIDPKELQKALRFLHHRVGVLLYYPEVEAIKDTVICQMQVVFDSASNLIHNTFTFDRVGKYASKEFREKGQFSLKDVKEAASGYTDSLIPLEKLVMLLQHLNVLTPIPPSQSSEDGPHTSEPTYFMPCVLQSARASDLKVTTSSEDPPPLLLRYECGYVPVGVFPAMITNLISQQQEEWVLIHKGLYKNRVQFYVGKDYDTVSFILHSRFIEIAVARRKDFEIPTVSLCSHVRGVIQSTLKNVTLRMNYHFKMGYRFGFECPTHPGREHLCVLASENATRMECLQNTEDITIVQLAQHHKLWFKEVNCDFASVVQPSTLIITSPAAHPTTKASSSSANLHLASDTAQSTLLSASHKEELSPSLKFLNLLKWEDEQKRVHTFKLKSRVSTKWRDFGWLLGLERNTLDEFDSRYRGESSSCWNRVMEHWLNGRGEPDYPPTWEGLYALLQDTEHENLARDLRKAVHAYSCSSF